MKTSPLDLVLLGLACWVHAACASGADGPQIGSQPPEISSLKLLQAPAEARPDFAQMKGEVIVLEFWATWCGPCVAALPHLNELAEKCHDLPVQFIAITDEDEATIQKFLQKKPIKGWVGLDRERSVNKAYGVTMIPHTVIVDQQGRIADITYPSSVTEARLRDLLAAKNIASVPRREEDFYRAGELPKGMLDGEPPLYQVMIRPSKMTSWQGTGGGGGLTALGMSVREALSVVYEIASCRILPAPLPEGRFDWVAKTPDGSDETRNALLRQAMQATFGITAARETREREVFVLTQQRANAPGLVPAATKASSHSAAPGSIEGVNMSIDELRQELEQSLGQPVLNESGIEGGFDIDLRWKQPEGTPSNPEGLIRAVEKQLGLALAPARRRIEVLVVQRTSGK